MQRLESNPIVDTINAATKKRVAGLIDRGIEPQVAVVLVGEDPNSLRFISVKSKRSKEVGIIMSLYQMPEESTAAEVAEVLAFLANDPDIHGIVLQLPLPETFTAEQTDSFIRMIPEQKDVDGLRGEWQKSVPKPLSLENFLNPVGPFLPPTPLAVFSLLDWYDLNEDDAHTVVVGKGRLVGKPLYDMLTASGNSVEAVDIATDDILKHTTKADVLVTGTGEKDLITYQWVKEDAVVINCSEDVHEDSVTQVAKALSPARGGVGPLTVAWLLHNVSVAALRNTTHE